MKQSGFYHRDSIWNIQGYAPAYMIGEKSVIIVSLNICQKELLSLFKWKVWIR